MAQRPRRGSARDRRPEDPRVAFRPTRVDEIAWVRSLERDPDVRSFILPWSETEHRDAVGDPGWAHWVVVDETSGSPVGFMVLGGVGTETIELTRIVTAPRGRGFGRAALRRLRDFLFGEWKAQRLWLDVFPFNERGRRLYESEGFVRVRGPSESVGRDTPESALIVMELRK